MALLDTFFSKKRKVESVILVDISADGVRGAYARFEEKSEPTILYTRALPFAAHPDEPHESAMLRALSLLGNALITEGAPELARTTGSAGVDMVLLSINAPWQETTVRTERFHEKNDFIFTEKLVNQKLAKQRTPDSDKKLLVDESIICTRLNGYATRNPYGKRVHRASITLLTSRIERETARKIIGKFEKLFHTKKIFSIAGNSLRYQAVAELFPHDQEGIILDATSQSTTAVALLHRGVLSSMTDVETPSGAKDWIAAIIPALSDIAKTYPLPRTIFLIAAEENREPFRKMLCDAQGMGLWLSDNPPKIVPVLNTVLTQTVRTTTAAKPNIILLLMAYYYEKKRFSPQEESVHNL